MKYSNQLLPDFEIIREIQSDKPLEVVIISDVSRHERKCVLRLMPSDLSQDGAAVNLFVDFFTRFSEIINRAYIPIVYSVSGHPDSGVYVLEEYVSGINLKSFIEKNHQNPDFDEQLVTILGRACEALHHAHQRDIYHLCVTPEDILIDEVTGKVKLVGFGVQIFADIKQMDLLSESAKKTIAPEILYGSKPRLSADVYSLARVISETCPELFKESDLLSKALSLEPSERYQSARDLEAALGHFMDEKKRPTQSREFETPVESRGGLKPVPNNKPVVSEPPPIKSDHHDDKQEPAPQTQVTADLKPVSVTLSNQKTFSTKTIIGITACILLLAVGFGSYNHYQKQALETEQAIASKKETDRIAALEKERLAALEREKLERERLEKEREDARIKEAERTAAFEKAQREKDAEIARLREELQLPPIARNYPEDVKELFRKAMNGDMDAQMEIGRKLQNGNGHAGRDLPGALKWYRKAADQGHAQAQNNLGRMYELGLGVFRDYPEAVKWYRKASEQGNLEAQYHLGVTYKFGLGVSKDDAEAMKWYRKAAEKGYAKAQTELGFRYRKGEGVPKNEQEAIKWFKKAADQGDDMAKSVLRRLGPNP